MELSKDQEDIVQRIINLSGDCLESSVCKSCPFKKKCLPEFIRAKGERPTHGERLAMALNTLSRSILIIEEG